MNLKRIDHVSLNAADRPRTVAFYAELLGLSVEGADRPADAPVFLGPPGARIGVFADRDPGLRHVALATDAATQAAILARVRDRDLPHHVERRSVYFPDPDGAWIEVLVA